MISSGRKTLLLIFLVNFVLSCQSLPVGQFYPYGFSAGDNRAPTNDDGNSGKIFITMPFPYFDKFHNSLFVNTNGVVSFLRAVSQYTPEAFPMGNDKRFLTAFWADVDTNNGGVVWYRETTDRNILEKATNDVRQAFIKQFNFVATWVFITTWDQVAFYGASRINRNRRNTFQAIMMSNGRHSFVRYNYATIVWTTGTASGGSSQGLGGTPAQCGFNAGDGVRFFTIPGSRSSAVLNLPRTSNIGIPGAWMFRIDNANIEAGGCNIKGSLSVSPSSGSMLGGENILVSGPCFHPGDRIVCKFDGKPTRGNYINAIRAFCAVPMTNKTGRVPLRVSLDNGVTFTFHGMFTYVKIPNVVPRVTRISPDTWMEGRNVEVTWDSAQLGSSSQKVSVQISRYVKNGSDIRFHSHYTVIGERPNDGRCTINVRAGQGEGGQDGRFVTLVRVVQKPFSQTKSPAAWIWSDLFMWLNYNKAKSRCKIWALKEPNPNMFTDDPTLLACPRNLLQAMADRGRYTEDDFFHSQNEFEYGCAPHHRGDKLCMRTVTPSDQGAGQQCCYNQQGNLILRLGSAGSLDRVHIDKGIPYISHFFHDIVPYSDCCFLSGKESCRTFYTKRPSDNGQKYEPPRPATAFGDPHITTLDGVEYTFNGYGEFTVLNVLPSGFTLQGRMEPLSGGSAGTVYTAFVTKENGSDTVQVQLNGRGMVDVLINGEMAELEHGVTEFQGVSILNCANTTKYSVIFQSGISVTIIGTPDLLQLIMLVPQRFRGNTSGLLGYWNDDKEMDFLLPDGSFIETNSNARKIHREFAMKWETTEHESLFEYQQGKSHAYYSHPNYEPTFIDKDNIRFSNPVLEEEARDACDDNVQCLFDILVTGNVDIGRASRETHSEFSAIVNTTIKKACIPIYPNITGAVVQRNDTPDGRIMYQITCSKGYYMQGSGFLSCKDGEWNGTVPKCGKKGGFSCTGRPNGNYPDPNNCRRYIACSINLTYHMPCPAELKWNNAKKRCDWPQNANPPCGPLSHSAPLYNCSVQITSNNTCSEGNNTNGNYPDHSNCHGYIACANGLTYHMTCPDQLKWNDRQKRCDWPQHAYPACSGATATPTTVPVTSPVGVGGNFCRGKANINYPDPNNCYGYIACSNGLTYHMPCPARLKWNDRQKRCDHDSPQHAYPGCSGAHQWPSYHCVVPNGNQQSNFCGNKVNGNYPDSANCYGYMACSNGITYRMPCPAGLVWNDAQKICDWKRNVRPPCGNSTIPVTTSSPVTPATTSAQGGFSCTGRPNGNYPDPNNCRRYIACSNNLTYHMPCPAELKWNNAKKRCDWPQNANPPCGPLSHSAPLYNCSVQITSNSTCNEGNNTNGNYPDPNNCHGYIACANGLTYHMPCPDQLKWNDRQKRCDWPRHAYPACSGATAAPTTVPVSSPVGVGGNFCHGKANTNYPDPNNCYGYIACSNGITYHMPCPARLKWSDRQKRCDHDSPQHAYPGCSGAHQWPSYHCVLPNGNQQSDFCSNKVNGNYPDSANLYGYISCSNGITYHMPCPAGLVWKNASKRCEWKRNVPPTYGTSTTPATTSSPVTTPVQNSFNCADKTNGNYPNPNDCNGYIACSNGNTYRMPCPAGLVWNNVRTRCDWTYNVRQPCGTRAK